MWVFQNITLHRETNSAESQAKLGLRSTLSSAITIIFLRIVIKVFLSYGMALKDHIVYANKLIVPFSLREICKYAYASLILTICNYNWTKWSTICSVQRGEAYWKLQARYPSELYEARPSY